MDQNVLPPPPSTTAPSEQGEHISNLSTRPNLNEQNDSYDARIVNHSHHSQSIHLGRENNNVPQKSEKQSSNPSQNYNKAHSQPLIENSNFPDLNQNVSQLLAQQDCKNSKDHFQKKVQFLTFDRNWEQELKQQQAHRDQEYEIFQENNEMLLTQKQDDGELGFFGKDSNQLDIVVEQDRRSDLSNQVKVNQFISNIPNIIYEEQSHSSHSVKEEPIFPLFENGVKDQSQSNLLDFGFSKQSRRAPHLTWTGRPQHTIIEPAKQQNSNSIQVFNNDSSFSSLNENNNRVTSIQNFSTISQIGYKQPEQPMVIEQTVQNSQSKHSSKYQSVHSSKHSEKNVSNHSSKHSSRNDNQFIKIEVHNCKQELLDSHRKNNDIYGITPKQQVHIIEKQQQPIEHSWQENIPQTTVHEEANLDNQTKNQSQQIIFKQEQKQNYPLSETFIHPQQQAKQQQRQQSLHQQTVEQIIQKLHNIIQSNIPQQQKAQEGGKILEKHINFLFLSPRTDIGKQILSDGKYCVPLIQIILMKETDNITKNVLRKYLHLTFASKISKGQNKFIQYQHSSISISNVQPQAQQKPITKQSQSYANHTTHDTLHDTFNQSVYAQHGSNGKNQSENMVVENINEPFKRTVVTRQPVAALKSQKPTRKTRLKTKAKGKGKTTAKKSAVKFEQDLNQSHEKQEVIPYSQAEKKSERSSYRKSRQSQSILNDSFNKVDQKQFGSKFTFILRDNLKSEQKQLVQVRKSRRLANKHNDSQGKQRHNTRKTSSQKSPQVSSGKKKLRISGSKRFMQQQIDINFIKQNMKVLVIKNGTTLQQFQALTPLDQDIINIINDYKKEVSNQRSNGLPSQEQAQQQAQDSTNSINNSNNVSNTNAESLSISRQQYKKKLSKYRIPKVLIINKVIDPNINNHGIYALLELNPLSQIVHGVKYVLTPITNLSRASKKLIDEDLQRAKQIVNDQFDNFAFIQPSDSILKQIKKEDDRRLKNK